nr:MULTISPECIES: (2Fe-2S)-binding protein [unclassified Nannocystis]
MSAGTSLSPGHARVRPRSPADIDGRPPLRYPSGVRVLLCQCNTVFEHEVIACVRRGARSVEEVGDDCEAGTGCGSCRGAIKTILEEEAQKRRGGRDGGAPEALFQLPLFKTRKE